jgi:hypothetical protein
VHSGEPRLSRERKRRRSRNVRTACQSAKSNSRDLHLWFAVDHREILMMCGS